jgi:hypothetical protein
MFIFAEARLFTSARAPRSHKEALRRLELLEVQYAVDLFE